MMIFRVLKILVFVYRLEVDEENQNWIRDFLRENAC